MDTYVFGFLVATLAIPSSCTPSAFLARSTRSSQGPCHQLQLYTDMKLCYGPLIAVTEMQFKGKGDEVKAKCRHVETAGRCFSTRMLECGQPGATLSEMLANIFQYVCGEGLSSLMSGEDCWRQETLKADIAVCTERMETGFRTDGYNAWCRLTREYIRCIGDKVRVKPQCSVRSANYVEELLRRSYGPAAQGMRCNLRARATRDVIDRPELTL